MPSVLDIIRSMSGRPVMGGQSAPIYEPMVTTPTGVATGMGQVAPAGPRPQPSNRQPIYEPMTMNPMGGYTGMGNPYPVPNQAERDIDATARQFRSAYPPPTGQDIMKQLMAANGGTPSNGSMADARAQEIAFANQAQNPAGSMGAARQQEIAFANSQPNPRGGGKGGGQMYGPTMADMPNGGQPAYYTMDPGDGGILRTIMSPNGMPPSIPGMTATNMQSVDPNQGMLSRILRGAF